MSLGLIRKQVISLNDVRKNAYTHSAVPAGQYLEKFTKDLTKLARDGKLDPVIGREDEIRRTIQVLSRRTKNNPVLYGEPGEYSFNFRSIAKNDVISETMLK